MTVITRFAPSPTGSLHIGGVRTALFSWLYARHYGGQFVLRIEDTDKERSTDEAVQLILDGLSWLGLDYDNGPYYQSNRYERYLEVIELLLSKGYAYRCSCSKERLEKIRAEAIKKGIKPRYDGHCSSLGLTGKNTVIRFRNPKDGEIIVDDLVQGYVTYANYELDDLIIARSDGTPTYNFTVVIDDMDMQITHVIRGDDHLNNTPRQINILKALGANIPRYAHIPMILGEDGTKLSKRTGAKSIMHYSKEGYLPEALLNYIVRLGWSHGDQEIFSIKEMIDLFELNNVNKSAASINPEKLTWLNQHYMKSISNQKMLEPLSKLLISMDVDVDSGPDLLDLIEVQKIRTKTLLDIAKQSIFFYEDFDEYDANSAKKHLRLVVLEPLMALRGKLEKLNSWEVGSIKDSIAHVAEDFNIKAGKIAQPLRVAITGTGVSPSINDTLLLLGKKKSIKRLSKGINYIKNRLES